jgi:hypothetical protein
MEEAKSHVRLTVKSQEQALSGRALMTKNIIDDETIEACRRGESDAFRLLFEAYKKLFLNCGNKRKERQMKSTLTRSVIPIALLVVLTAVALSKASDHVAITAHEWGTFTSIAGEDGRAMSWRPYGGPTDLPCFVDRWPGSGKGPLAGTVRMETPVLFVGRLEIITPATIESVKQAIDRHDRASLEKYGRFLEPIAKRIGTKSPLLDAISSAYLSRSSDCDK